MKRKFTVIVAAVILSMVSVTGGCGNSSKGSAESSDQISMDQAAEDGAAVDRAANSAGASHTEMKAEDDMDLAEGTDAGPLSGTADSQAQSVNQKLIYTYNYSVETKEFDVFYEKISKKTSQLGGYVENSETEGSVSDGINRYASLTLRIPADRMDQMISLLNTDSNITYQSRSSENITLKYVDMESHLKALRTEQKTLLQLLEKADKLKDVIALQSQLTEIRYEIESYESQLRLYDNLVDYSTLYLNITEVERTTNVATKKTSFAEEAFNKLSDNLYALGQWMRSAAIWAIGSMPLLILLAVIGGCIFRFWKKRKKHQTHETETQEEDS